MKKSVTVKLKFNKPKRKPRQVPIKYGRLYYYDHSNNGDPIVVLAIGPGSDGDTFSGAVMRTKNDFAPHMDPLGASNSAFVRSAFRPFKGTLTIESK